MIQSFKNHKKRKTEKKKFISEGSLKQLNDNELSNVISVNNDIPKEVSKISKDDKQTFEYFKTLYKSKIDAKCEQDYGKVDDQKLWDDCAKELFLKSRNYILQGDEYKAKADLEESKKIIENATDNAKSYRKSLQRELNQIENQIANSDPESNISKLEDRKEFLLNKLSELDFAYRDQLEESKLLEGISTRIVDRGLDTMIAHYPDKNALITEIVAAIKKNILQFEQSEIFEGMTVDEYAKEYSMEALGESKELEEEKEYTEEEKFNYSLLDRLVQDCKYFLGNDNGFEDHLWAHNVEDQIAKMREIYNSLEEKPDWITLEDIENYEKEMKNKLQSKSNKTESYNCDKCGAENIEGEYLLTNKENKELHICTDCGNKYSLAELEQIKLTEGDYEDLTLDEMVLKSYNYFIKEVHRTPTIDDLFDDIINNNYDQEYLDDSSQRALAQSYKKLKTAVKNQNLKLEENKLQEDQYENERRKGRPNTKKIAEEIYEEDPESWQKDAKACKDVYEFTKQYQAELSAEWNLSFSAVQDVCMWIYALATDHSNTKK